jgi:hypothetical protein
MKKYCSLPWIPAPDDLAEGATSYEKATALWQGLKGVYNPLPTNIGGAQDTDPTGTHLQFKIQKDGRTYLSWDGNSNFNWRYWNFHAGLASPYWTTAGTAPTYQNLFNNVMESGIDGYGGKGFGYVLLPSESDPDVQKKLFVCRSTDWYLAPPDPAFVDAPIEYTFTNGQKGEILLPPGRYQMLLKPGCTRTNYNITAGDASNYGGDRIYHFTVTEEIPFVYYAGIDAYSSGGSEPAITSPYGPSWVILNGEVILEQCGSVGNSLNYCHCNFEDALWNEFQTMMQNNTRTPNGCAIFQNMNGRPPDTYYSSTGGIFVGKFRRAAEDQEYYAVQTTNTIKMLVGWSYHSVDSETVPGALRSGSSYYNSMYPLPKESTVWGNYPTAANVYGSVVLKRLDLE